MTAPSKSPPRPALPPPRLFISAPRGFDVAEDEPPPTAALSTFPSNPSNRPIMHSSPAVLVREDNILRPEGNWGRTPNLFHEFASRLFATEAPSSTREFMK